MNDGKMDEYLQTVIQEIKHKYIIFCVKYLVITENIIIFAIDVPSHKN